MIVNSRIIRRRENTLLIFGPSESAAYKLSQQDVMAIEQETGRSLEFLTESEVTQTVEGLGIQLLELDDRERNQIAELGAELAAELGDDEPPSEDEEGIVEQADDAREVEGPDEEISIPREVVAPPPPENGEPMQPTTEEEEPESDRSRLLMGVILAILALAAVTVILVLAGVFQTDEPGGETATSTPAATAPLPTLEPGIPIVTANVTTLIYSGPGTNYEIIGIMAAGGTAESVGVSEDRLWWAIAVPGDPDVQGWVQAANVTVSNAELVPVIPAPPPPTPTPVPPLVITDWRGEYFSNPNLEGQSAVVRNDPSIDFNWGTDPPAPGMPSENWSARWTITRDVPAGTYQFSIWVDDGVRVYLDDNLIIDGWQVGNARNYTQDVSVTRGSHTVRVEYFQAGGSALIQLGIGYTEAYPDWKGEYFDNPNVEGAPLFVRNDSRIDFDWGSGSPAPGVPANNYSVRWTRRISFPAGDYLFQIDLEGGVRLWFDDRLLIDDWQNQGFRTLQADPGPVSEGEHDLRVEYFKLSGNGRITVSGEPVQEPENIPPVAVIDGPSQGQVGQSLQFSSSRSQAAPGSAIVSTNWNFGDNTSTSDANPIKIYNAPGTYVITLIVTDDKGLSGQSQLTVNISQLPATPAPVPPSAIIEGPSQGVVGQPLTFSGSSSSGQAPIVSYEWTFGDGGGAQGPVANHTYSREGAYVVALNITDQLGQRSSASLQIQIRLADTPQPTATPAETPSPSLPPIVNTGWSLTFLSDSQGGTVSILPGSQITAGFLVDDNMTGSAGCNTYTARYEAQDNTLVIGLPSVGNQTCDQPDGIMDQETRYLTLLVQTTSYEISGNELLLRDSAGQLLLRYQTGTLPE
jgi:PKD repeat protein